MLDIALAELTAGLPDAGQLIRALLRLFTAALCGAVIGLGRLGLALLATALAWIVLGALRRAESCVARQ